MKKLFASILLAGFVLPCACRAVDLKQAKFTQVINNVEVVSADKARHAAEVNDLFKMPDVLRTGPASRAELVADDKTITRVGANTIFSFDPANRSIDLQQGSLLFHSPHGKGGGTIHTGSATASVLGTTIIVTTTPNGGFKVLVLEGEAEIRFLNGMHLTLTPGQMTFVLPGGGTSPIVIFRLDQETKGSQLVNGFSGPLPSWLNINTEITRQLLLLLNNKLQDVDLVVGDNATPNAVQVRMDILPQGQSSPFDTDSSIISADKKVSDPLPVNYPPLDPAHVQNSPFAFPGVQSFTDGLLALGIISPSAGFAGNNIDIDTGNPVTPTSTDYIDLSAFAGSPDFDIMAKGDLRIWQSVIFSGTPARTFIGPEAPDAITLFAGVQMLIARDSTIAANTKLLGLVADSFGVLNISSGMVEVPGALENVSFINTGGDVNILSLSDLTIEGMNTDTTVYPNTAYHDTVYARGDAIIQSEAGLNLGTGIARGEVNDGYNVSIVAGRDVALYAGFNLNTASGDLNVGNTEIYAGDTGNLGEASSSGGSISLNAGGDVKIQSSSLYAYAAETTTSETVNTYAAGNVNVNAGGFVDVENTDVNQDNSVFVNAGEYVFLYDVQRYDDSSLDTYLTDWNITAGSYVEIDADATVRIFNSYIYAGGDVNISSGGTTSTALLNTSSGDNIDLEDSTIYAGDNGSLGQSSTSGGAVNLRALDGNIHLSYDYVYAYGAAPSMGRIANNYAAGNVNINAGGFVDIEYSDINPDGSVYANAGGYVNLNDVFNNRYDGNSSDTYLTDWNIKAGSYVDIGADANVQIHDSAIYANNGDVNITSEGSVAVTGTSTIRGGGDITIGNSYVQAWDSVNVTANDGSVSINLGSTLIAENGDVNVTATGGGIDLKGNSILQANGSVYLTADGDININNSPISATSGNSIEQDGESSGDQVSISSGGKLTVTGNFGDNLFGYDIGADYKICLSGDDGVSLDDVLITTLDGNSLDKIRISGNGQIDITDGSELESDGSVKVRAYDGNVNILDSKILANGGDVYVSSDSGLLTVNAGHVFVNTDQLGDDADIYASGGVTLNGDSVIIKDTVIYAGGEVDITGDNGNVLIEDADAATGGGNVNITAVNGNLTLESGAAQHGVIINAVGAVNLNADGIISISDASITASGGDIDIMTSGDVNIQHSVLTAGGIVNANAIPKGQVILAGVTIEGGGSLTLGVAVTELNSSGDTIINADGKVSLTSDSGDLNIYNSAINAGVGSGSDIIDNSVTSPGNVFVNTTGGTIDISSGNDLRLFGATMSIGGDISISDSTRIAGNGDVDITTSGTVSISAEETVFISGSSLFGDNIQISGSTLTANNGNVNIRNNNILTVPKMSGLDVSQINRIDITSGSTITANSGNVNISTDGSVDLENSTINASAVTSLVRPATPVATTGDVTITAGAGLTFNGGSINADTAAGTIALTSTSGQTTIENGASAQSFYLNVNSPDGILIDGTSGGGVHLSGHTMNLKGSYTDSNKGITVDHADLTSYANVNMSAHTINLSFVGFGAGSYDNFQTFYGALAANPNTGSAPQTGYLNFINGVTYAGTLITSANQSTYVNPASGPGVYVSTLPP